MRANRTIILESLKKCGIFAVLLLFACSPDIPIKPYKPVHSNTKPFSCFECDPPVTYGYCCPIVSGVAEAKAFTAINEIGEQMFYCDESKYNGQCDDGKNHYCPPPSKRLYVGCVITTDELPEYLSVAHVPVDTRLCFKTRADANGFADELTTINYPSSWNVAPCTIDGNNGYQIEYSDNRLVALQKVDGTAATKGFVSNAPHADVFAHYLNQTLPYTITHCSSTN